MFIIHDLADMHSMAEVTMWIVMVLPLSQSISHGSVQAAQTRKVIRQAMQEDASLFQYDEVYDDMQQQKQNKAETKKTADKKVTKVGCVLKSPCMLEK